MHKVAVGGTRVVESAGLDSLLHDGHGTLLGLRPSVEVKEAELEAVVNPLRRLRPRPHKGVAERGARALEQRDLPEYTDIILVEPEWRRRREVAIVVRPPRDILCLVGDHDVDLKDWVRGCAVVDAADSRVAKLIRGASRCNDGGVVAATAAAAATQLALFHQSVKARSRVTRDTPIHLTEREAAVSRCSEKNTCCRGQKSGSW